jgi:hypothetical protein
MNKLSKMMIGVAISAVMLNGCKTPDVVAPTVLQPNTYPNGVITELVDLSVQVTPTINTNGGGRVEGNITGAQVSISQNGSTQTQTVGANGIAVFEGLYPGSVSVFVTAPGFASYNYPSYEVDYNGQAQTGSNGNNSNQTVIGNQSLGVQLPPLAGTITGGFLVNVGTSTGIAVQGLQVTYTLSQSNGGFYYMPSVYTTTTDANGNFSFTGLPTEVVVNNNYYQQLQVSGSVNVNGQTGFVSDYSYSIYYLQNGVAVSQGVQTLNAN